MSNFLSTRGIHKRKMQQGIGLAIFSLFVISSLFVNQIAQALNQAAGNYGYYAGTYGYGSSSGGGTQTNLGNVRTSDAPPKAPSTFTCSATSITTGNCTWTAPTQTTINTSLNNLSKYVYKSGTASVSNCEDGTQYTTTSTLSLTLSSLSANTTYYVALCAVDGNLNTSTAVTAQFKTPVGASTKDVSSSGSTPSPSPSQPSQPEVAKPIPPVAPPDDKVTKEAPIVEKLILVVPQPKVHQFSLNVPSAVSISGVVHTVIVKSATVKSITFTIKSTPKTVTIEKGKSADIDTDDDGTKDTRATYNGLINGKAELSFVKLGSKDSCYLSKGGAYKSVNSSAVYYITDKCTKRAFTSATKFFTYFGDWKEVKVVEKNTLSLVIDDTLGFMPWGPKYDPKGGAFVKIVTEPKVYLLLNGKKYWVKTELVMAALYGKKWNTWIEDVDQGLINKYTSAPEITDTTKHLDGSIIKYAKSAKVYLLDSGKKRWIVDEAAFNSLGYRWDRIVTIADSEQYADGADLKK